MEKKFVVTIGREFGTGGRQIATELAKELGVELYDKGLLKHFCRRTLRRLQKPSQTLRCMPQESAENLLLGLLQLVAGLGGG